MLNENIQNLRESLITIIFWESGMWFENLANNNYWAFLFLEREYFYGKLFVAYATGNKWKNKLHCKKYEQWTLEG